VVAGALSECGAGALFGGFGGCRVRSAFGACRQEVRVQALGMAWLV
jgi:hypothetical protein